MAQSLPGDAATRLAVLVRELGNQVKHDTSTAFTPLAMELRQLDAGGRTRIDRAGPIITSALREAVADCPAGNRGWMVYVLASCLFNNGLSNTVEEVAECYLGQAPTDADHVFRARLNLCLALVAQSRGDARAVRESGQHVLEILAGAPSGQASQVAPVKLDLYGLLTRMENERGDFDAAKKHLGQVDQLVAASGSTYDRGMACLFRAEFLLLQDSTTEALELVREFRDELEQFDAAEAEPFEAAQLEALEPLLQVLHGTALCSESILQPSASAEAATLLGSAVAKHGLPNNQEVRARLGLLQIALRAGDLEAAAGQHARLRELVGVHGGKLGVQMLAEVEAYSAQLRRRQGAPHTELLAHRDRLRGAFADLLRRWQRTPVRNQSFLALHDRRQLVSELIELERKLDPERAGEQAADLMLRLQAMTTPARKAGVSPITVADLRRDFLGPTDAAALFLTALGQSHLVIISQRQAHLHRLAGWETLFPALRGFHRLLMRVAEEPAGELGARLDRMAWRLAKLLLAGDARAHLECEGTVTIADLGSLYDLPWECLRWDNERLLGETIAVNNLSSLPLGAVQTKRYQPAREASIGVLATLLGGKGGTGPRPRLQPESIHGLVKPFASHLVLLNNEATLAAMLRWTYEHAVTHIVAHGAALAGQPSLGLALTDAVLSHHDVAPTGGVRGLVVLSACGAGRASHQLGEEPYETTLGGAFLDAGAPAVIQPRADLRLRPHVDLMAAAFRSLAGGSAPAIAMRNARRLHAHAAVLLRFQHGQMRVFGLGHLPTIE